MSSQKKTSLKVTSMTPKTGGKQATILDMFQPDKTNFKIHCDKPETNESAADVREEQQIELKSVEVQTKLVSVKNKNDDSDNMTWTIALDEEGEHYKSLIESRKKYLQELELEHDTLKMKNFELLDENYSLTKNKEDALEILSEAKKISALLSPMLDDTTTDSNTQ